MALLTETARVSARRPCPVCGRPDWCLVSREGGDEPIYAVCQRVESRHRWEEAGWLHKLRHGQRRSRAHSITLDAGGHDFADLAREYRDHCSAARRAYLAGFLGVQATSLERLGLGWDGSAFTFPMEDGLGRVHGIRRRFPSSKQACVTGSRNGLFVPEGLLGVAPLLVCEGASDTAAMLDFGFEAIGRPDCGSARKAVCRHVRRQRPGAVVVVADNDLVGRQGAESLARALVIHCINVRVIAPPEATKDAREWVRAGATRADIENAIEGAAPLRLSVRVQRTGGRR